MRATIPHRQYYAGSAFLNSAPPASALPIPKFFQQLVTVIEETEGTGAAASSGEDTETESRSKTSTSTLPTKPTLMPISIKTDEMHHQF